MNTVEQTIVSRFIIKIMRDDISSNYTYEIALSKKDDQRQHMLQNDVLLKHIEAVLPRIETMLDEIIFSHTGMSVDLIDAVQKINRSNDDKKWTQNPLQAGFW